MRGLTRLTRLPLATTAVVTALLSFGGCGRSVHEDCGDVLQSLRMEHILLPRNPEERGAMVTDILLSLRAWDRAKPRVEREEVRQQGDRLAEKLRERLALLHDARFASPEQHPAPPGPSASAPDPKDPETRDKVLKEIASAGMIGLLGDTSLLPESEKALSANAADLRELKTSLSSWCATNR